MPLLTVLLIIAGYYIITTCEFFSPAKPVYTKEQRRKLLEKKIIKHGGKISKK